jgi:CheY-like chemotaxis protein
MAEGWRILVVEDDPLIALMLEGMLEDLACVVAGHAESVHAALSLIDRLSELDGAVLDCNLRGDKVWPVATRLAARSVPFVFSTGYDTSSIPVEFAGVPVLTKPILSERLDQELVSQLRARSATG